MMSEEKVPEFQSFYSFYNEQMTAVYAMIASARQFDGVDGHEVYGIIGEASLSAKKAWVMAQLNTVPKSGHFATPRMSYRYATDEDLLGAVRPLLGIASLSLNIENEGVEVAILETEYSKRFNLIRVAFKITIGCGHTGYSRSSLWLADVNTTLGDKAMNAASIHALKYFLKATFAISTGEDPDSSNGYLADSPSTENRPEPDSVRSMNKKQDLGRNAIQPTTGLGQNVGGNPSELEVASADDIRRLEDILVERGYDKNRALLFVNSWLSKRMAQPGTVTDISNIPAVALNALLEKMAIIGKSGVVKPDEPAKPDEQDGKTEGGS